VRRARRLPREQLDPYLVPDPPLVAGVPPSPPLLDWQSLFGNGRPVEIEIGFGKGLFLLTESQSRPEINFLGIEIERKYQLYAATRLAKRGIGNVRLVRGDARQVLRDRVPADSVRALHVYFPDPWWKKRHQKRRLFTADFVIHCQRVLEPGGRLHLATDVADYFQVITDLVRQHSALAPLPPPDPKQPAHDMDYLTNFERKFRQQGKEIYRASYEKTRAGLAAGG
jgi:tRNA (guanine-N7-)-methyltransferase